LANSLENAVFAATPAFEAQPGSAFRTDWTAPFESFKKLAVTLHTGWIEVVLDNGQSNYLSRDVVLEMESLVAVVSDCHPINCVVLSGGEKRAFSRGLDLKSFLALSMDEQLRFIERSNVLLSAIAQLPVPVICAVNGLCAGAGLELAMACDLRIASTRAMFSSPEVMYGLMPGGGVVQRLLRQVGRGQSMRLLAAGTMINASEALGIGLVEEITEPARLTEHCGYVARRLARAPRPSLVAIKKSIVEGLELPMAVAAHSDLRRSMEALRQAGQG
jgi:enoyl-CoA hydratase/carnithine racemase